MPRSKTTRRPSTQGPHGGVPALHRTPSPPTDRSHTERLFEDLRRSLVRSPGLLWGSLATSRLHRLAPHQLDPENELLAMSILSRPWTLTPLPSGDWAFTPPSSHPDEQALRGYLEMVGTSLTLQAASGEAVPHNAGEVVLGLLDLSGDDLAGTAYAVILRVATVMASTITQDRIREQLLVTSLAAGTWEWTAACADQAAPRGW